MPYRMASITYFSIRTGLGCWYNYLKVSPGVSTSRSVHTHTHTHTHTSQQGTSKTLHMSQQEKSPLWIQSPEKTSRVWIHGSRFSVPVPYYTQLKNTHTHTRARIRTHTPLLADYNPISRMICSWKKLNISNKGGLYIWETLANIDMATKGHSGQITKIYVMLKCSAKVAPPTVSLSLSQPPMPN